MRSKSNDLRRHIETRERRGEIIRRSGANVAQILSDDQIGLESSEQLSVDRINAFASADQLAHLAVNFRGRRTRINAGLDQRRLLSGFHRIIALMRDPEDAIAEAKSIKNFGSGRKQRDNSHEFRAARRTWRAPARNCSYSRYFARMTLNFARSGDQLEIICTAGT